MFTMFDLDLQNKLENEIQEIFGNFPDNGDEIFKVLKYFEDFIRLDLFPPENLNKNQVCILMADLIIFNNLPNEFSTAIKEVQAAVEYAYS